MTSLHLSCIHSPALHTCFLSIKHMDCRFFYASSACIYPENKQLDTEVEGGGLKEKDAWPAQVCLLIALLPRAAPVSTRLLSLCAPHASAAILQLLVQVRR